MYLQKFKLFTKFVISILFCIILNCTLVINAIAEPNQKDADDIFSPKIQLPEIEAKSYILYDYHTGKILIGFKYDRRQYPASLTKMMTSYVLGQAIQQNRVKLSDMVTISKNAWGKKFPDSSKMFLDVNKQVSIADLSRGIIVVSGNDACVAIAEYIAGSEQKFVAIMNAYAKKLGLNDTNFMTVHGLDHPDQYSTALDLAKLGQALIRDLPNEYALYKEKEFTHAKIKQKNRNGLLWDKSLKVDGIKTGHTDQAGYNLVASATKGSMRLISVVMGVDTYKGREAESKKLLEWGFKNFITLKPVSANQVISQHKVYYAQQKFVELGSDKDIFLTIPKRQQDKLEVKYTLVNEIFKAPLKQNEVVGSINYYLDGEKIYSSNLIVLDDVVSGGWFTSLTDWFVLLFK